MYELMLLLSVAIFIGAVVLYAREPNASAFHPVTFYLMFHGLVFVARPLSAWYYDFDRVYKAMRFTPTETDKIEALICTNLALVVFLAVALLIVREPLQFRQGPFDVVQRRSLSERFLVIAVVLGSMAAYSIYWMWDFRASDLGGVADLDLRTGARAMRATNGYFYQSALMLAPIVAIIAYLGRFTPWSLLPFVMFAVFRFGAGQRGDVVAAAVMIALLFMFDRRRRWPTWGVVAAALVIIPVFDSIQTDRGAGIREAVGVEEVASSDYVEVRSDERFLESVDLSNLEMVEFLTWSIPEKSGSYDYFLGNLQILTEPIPRALWPDKPVGAPIKLFELYSHAVTINGVMSVPGMGWMYLGFPGVAIWAAVFALIYASAYKAFARSNQSNIAVLAYMIFLSTAVVGFRDGALLTVLKQSLFFFTPLVALMIVSYLTNLPSAEELRRAAALRTLEAQGLPNTPQGRRRASAGREVSAPPKQPVTDRMAEAPRARRRARMAGEA